MCVGGRDYCTKVRLYDDVEISLYSSTMFRFRVSGLEGDKFPEEYEIPFVVGKLESWPQVPYTQWEDEEYSYVETSDIRIRVTHNDHSWEIFTPGGAQQIHPSGGPIYGMFRDGYTVFDSASAFGERNLNSRYAHWFYNAETGRYVDTYLAEDLILDTYFIYGPEYGNLFSQFNELVGPEPLLPKKAYGFFQTQHRLCEGTQEELMTLALVFRERGIPCDYFIVDIEWGDGCDGDEQVKLGSRMDWSLNYIHPMSPEGMITRLKRMHFDMMLIHHSAPDFPHRTGQGWTESVWDEATWWSKLEEGLDNGVQGTWQDTRRNDVTDSVIWKGLQDYFGPEQRVLFMGCRCMQKSHPWPTPPNTIPINQIIGARRYPFDWTGDCGLTWDELKWQIRAITNTHGSMKGVTYVTNDSMTYDWKIQARWNQFIDFNTVSRSHDLKPWGILGKGGEAGEPEVATAEDKAAVATAVQGETSGHPTAEESIRKHRKLRYRLLPYIYSHAFINYQTGIPICRPMLLAFPEDENCNADQWPYQYMFGESILVAPVYADVVTMEIYLPAGTDWIDYWNEEVYTGGEVIQYDTSDIEKLPMFVRSGAIIPMRDDCNWIDPTLPDDPFSLDIYPSKASSFTLYEDDGVSTYYQGGAYSLTQIACRKEGEANVRLSIGRAKGEYAGMLQQRSYILNVHHYETEPNRVTLSGNGLPRNSEPTFGEATGDGWSYDSDNGIVRIQIRRSTKKDTWIEIIR